MTNKEKNEICAICGKSIKGFAFHHWETKSSFCSMDCLTKFESKLLIAEQENN